MIDDAKGEIVIEMFEVIENFREFRFKKESFEINRVGSWNGFDGMIFFLKMEFVKFV